MPDVAQPDTLTRREAQTEYRSVQHYIDQRPTWPDGTTVPYVPMT